MINIKQLLENIAVADAVGSPLEFNRNPTKLTFMASLKQNKLNITDDTQMALFLTEELTTGLNIEKAYLNWYTTQTCSYSVADKEEKSLLQFKELYSIEAPGVTVLASLKNISKGKSVLNNSKGCGTVMRVAPWALWGVLNQIDDSTICSLVRKDSLLTHKHPEASDCAEYFVLYLMELLKESCSYPSIFIVNDKLPNNCFSSRALEYARGEHPQKAYGYEGWTAEECLAIGLWSFINSSTYLEAIELATVIRGDSDSCGVIAGALCACVGLFPPEDYIKKLNVNKVIQYLHNCN